MITALEKVALTVSSRGLRRHLFRLGELKEDGILHESDRRVTDAHTMIVRGLGQAQLFDVENVNEWLHQMGRHNYLETVEGLPCCLPLYPYTYLEWPAEGARCAALVACSGILDPSEEKMAMIFTFDIAGGAAYYNGSAHVWFTPEGTATFARDEDDKIKGVMGVPSEEVYAIIRDDEEVAKSFYNSLSWSAVVALFTFSLLHCTNVKVVEVDPRSMMSRQQRRAAERRREDPILYKVLEVKPFGSYRKSANEPQGEGRTKRLHHVRGHFMEFGPEYGKGLAFGRIAGRFYCPPHIRGDLAEGAVAKTYKLAKPTGKEDRSQYGR